MRGDQGRTRRGSDADADGTRMGLVRVGVGLGRALWQRCRVVGNALAGGATRTKVTFNSTGERVRVLTHWGRPGDFHRSQPGWEGTWRELLSTTGRGEVPRKGLGELRFTSWGGTWRGRSVSPLRALAGKRGREPPGNMSEGPPSPTGGVVEFALVVGWTSCELKGAEGVLVSVSRCGMLIWGKLGRSTQTGGPDLQDLMIARPDLWVSRNLSPSNMDAQAEEKQRQRQERREARKERRAKGQCRNELALAHCKRQKCVGTGAGACGLSVFQMGCGASSTVYALRPIPPGPVEPVERLSFPVLLMYHQGRPRHRSASFCSRVPCC